MLASRSFAPWIACLRRERNYRFHLAYLWLPSPELAVSRVGERIRAGGHAVPPDDIRRRYRRGVSNFFSIYRPIADSWELHDNSTTPSKLIAAQGTSGPMKFGNAELWNTILLGVPISEVMDIFTRAGREALARHKALGESVAVWRDGRVVVIPPEEIEI